jgi:hypothetical protein
LSHLTVQRNGKGQSDVPFERVVISDVDGHASSNELRVAAV